MDGGEANLEVSDIRRSSLSQLTREGDIDRVRHFLDFSGDESLSKINKLDESKVIKIYLEKLFVGKSNEL